MSGTTDCTSRYAARNQSGAPVPATVVVDEVLVDTDDPDDDEGDDVEDVERQGGLCEPEDPTAHIHRHRCPRGVPRLRHAVNDANPPTTKNSGMICPTQVTGANQGCDSSGRDTMICPSGPRPTPTIIRWMATTSSTREHPREVERQIALGEVDRGGLLRSGNSGLALANGVGHGRPA